MDADVTVRELFTREYLGVSESDTVGDAVGLMLEEGALEVVVLRGAEPVGMLTAQDALALLVADEDPTSVPVAEAMSGTVPSVRPEATLVEAAGRIADDGVTALLVTDGDELLGILSERDLVRATASLAGGRVTAGPGESRSTPAEELRVAGDERAEAAVTTQGAEGTETGESPPGEYSRQSVCEICGSLTPDLHNFNGQLICGDCREV